MIRCSFKDCDIAFLKVNGAFVHGRWFCSDTCSDKDPEVQELKELYAKGIEFNNNKLDEDEESGDSLPEDFEI